MEGSIRGRIPRCTAGSVESEFGSDGCSLDFETGDSLSCIESTDSLCLVEEGGNPVSAVALKGDGRKVAIDKLGEAS